MDYLMYGYEGGPVRHEVDADGTEREIHHRDGYWAKLKEKEGNTKYDDDVIHVDLDLQNLVDAYQSGKPLYLNGERLSDYEVELFINALKGPTEYLQHNRKHKDDDGGGDDD